MSYEEAVEATVSRRQAQQEIGKHDCEGWEAFVKDFGDHAQYRGADVLGWLGY